MQNELISAKDFCRGHDIEISFIRFLGEYELIEVTTVGEAIYFPLEQLHEVEKMARLHYELNINMEGIDAIRNLLSQMEIMHDEMNTMRNRLRQYESDL